MKSPMTQILMITLAIVFATALTVTVTLLCISYIGRTPNNFFQTQPLQNYDTQSFHVSEQTTPLPPSHPTEAIESTESSHTVIEEEETESVLQNDPIEPHTLLAFASNANGTCTVIGIGECRDVCITIPS